MKKIIRCLGWDTVRGYCISRKLYTNGCNQEYEKLYKFITKKKYIISDKDLYNISYDIWMHSITDLEIMDIFTGLNSQSYYEEIEA